jgi:hypothetical protein
MRSRLSVAHAVVSSLLLITACKTAALAPNVSPTAISNPVLPGERVRVTHNSRCCDSPLIGIQKFLTRDTLTLWLQRGTQSDAIPRENITEIARWNAGRTHKAAGVGYGFLIGAFAGGALGYSTACAHCDGDWRPLGAIAGSIVGGGAGSLVGLVVGTARRGFWEVVP